MEQQILELEQQLRPILQVFDGKLRHTYYERTCMLAKKYKAFITGVGLDDYLEPFVLREGLDKSKNSLFEQRVRLTKHIIPSICETLTSATYKIPRSNGKVEVFETPNENLKKIIAKFYGDYDVDYWMSNRFLELNNTDPNAFVILEWDDFDNKTQHAEPYPYECYSENVIYYENKNNILQFLIVQDGNKIYLYNKNNTVIFNKVDTKKEATNYSENDIGKIVNINDKLYLIVSTMTVYEVIFPLPHNLGVVPAFCVGSYRDIYSNGTTYVSIFHSALGQLEKTIKVNSEMDLQMTIHAFLQKIQFVSKCDDIDCNCGVNQLNGRECTQCKGTGLKPVTTTADAITIALPKNKEDAFDINNLVKYVDVPTEILDFQKTYLKDLKDEAIRVVYNSEVFTKITNTATEAVIDIQQVYDKLFPLALNYANKSIYIHQLIAKISQTENGLIYSMKFDKDFKFKSTDDLINELQNANNSGIDGYLKSEIEDKIASVIFDNDIYSLLKYKVKKSFNPISNKSESERIFLLNSNLISNDDKILWSYFDKIFDELVMENPNFYELVREKQFELLNKKVAEYKEIIGNQTPSVQQFSQTK